MKMIAPGATLGVLGGGQLGRMFVWAAQRMGYRSVVLDPDVQSPAGAVAHQHICAALDDEKALDELAQTCPAVTTEFENVPAASLELLAKKIRVSPAASAVQIAQQRSLEKAFLLHVAATYEHGIPPVDFHNIQSLEDIEYAPAQCFPGILKTATLGYDGKGQVSVNSQQEAAEAFARMGSLPCVLEHRVQLAAECSVIVARGADGKSVCLPVARNQHVNGILAASEIYEGNLPLFLIERAQEATKKIANELNYVGVLCVEFFILEDMNGNLSKTSFLRTNEIAPRPHNSGHWSIEGSSCSQFELQLRTLCGLPLAEPKLLLPSVMLNLLGDAWLDSAGKKREPDWAKLLKLPNVNLHLYGKTEARKGRKMGHITITGQSAKECVERAVQVAQLLHLPYQPSLPL